MFTPELERRRELKLQQDKQYAADLRQQIAEKAQRAGLNPPAIQYTNRNSPSSSGMPSASPPSNRTSTALVPYGTARSSSSLSYQPLDPLPDLPQTSIAPLNLEVTTFAIDTIPDLPRPIIHSSAIEPGAFRDRISSIQSQIDEQKGDYVKSMETAERLRSRTFPSISQLIAELDDILDTTVSGKIPNALKYVNDLTGHNKEQLNASASNFFSLTDGLKESLDDKLRKSQQLEHNITEFGDNAKNGLLDVRAEMGRTRDVLDATLQKANKLEKREGNIISELAKYNTEFEIVDTTASNSFTELVRNIVAVTKSAPAQLAASIREESSVRDQAAATIHLQAEEMNKRASERIKEIQDTLAAMTDAFKNSLEDLSSSISDAITQTQSETASSSADLSRQIDTVISETDSNMKSVTNEIVSTISEIRSNCQSARDSLEDSIVIESSVCSQNHKKVLEKFDHLKAVVIKERELQESHIQVMLRDCVKNSQDHRTRLMQPADVNIQYIKAKKIDMDRIESNLESLENKMNLLRQQINDSLNSLNRSIDDTRHYINEARSMTVDSLEMFTKDIDNLQNLDREKMANKSDISNEEEKFNQEVEQRVNFIEKQIMMAMQNLGQLTAGGDVQEKAQNLPATIALENLVNEDQKVPNLKVSDDEPVEIKTEENIETEQNEQQEQPETVQTKKRRHHHRRKYDLDNEETIQPKNEEEEAKQEVVEENNEDEEEQAVEDQNEEEIIDEEEEIVDMKENVQEKPVEVVE